MGRHCMNFTRLGSIPNMPVIVYRVNISFNSPNPTFVSSSVMQLTFQLFFSKRTSRSNCKAGGVQTVSQTRFLHLLLNVKKVQILKLR